MGSLCPKRRSSPPLAFVNQGSASHLTSAVCASKEGEVGDFLDPRTLQDLLAFGDNLAKAQGASPKIINELALEDYLGNPE
jgi:hypothetical protein